MISGELPPPAQPGEEGSEATSVDASYAALIDTLPAHLRAAAEELPRRLGLTSLAHGGWGDFVSLHPNRELPLYAAEQANGGRSISRERLQRFLRAHHLGGFHWLLRDRIEDGQVAADATLLELAQCLGDQWRRALVDATLNPVLVDALIQDATTRWRQGTRMEREVLAGGDVEPRRYAQLVRDKLRWIGVPARALIMVDGGSSARRGAFICSHDLFLVGLQLVDDVIDQQEDRALRGHDVPSALGCSAGALLRAAPLLIKRGAAAAFGGGFPWWSAWLDAFAGALRSLRLDGDAMADQLEAIGLAGQVEELVAGDDGALVGHQHRTTDVRPRAGVE